MNSCQRRSLGSFAVAGLVWWPWYARASTAAARAWDVAPFSDLQIALPATTVLIQPRLRSVLSIRAASEVLRAVVVDQSTGRRLTLRSQAFQTRAPIEVEVGYTALQRLDLSCGGQVRLVGPTTPGGGGQLFIRLDGTTELDATGLNVNFLQFESHGTGDVHLEGQAKSQRVSLSGAGNYRAVKLRSDSIDLSLDGAGDAEVQARHTLDVRLDGVGSVQYLGHPRVRQRGDGAGNLLSVQGDKP